MVWTVLLDYWKALPWWDYLDLGQVWGTVRPFVIWGQVVVFVCLLLVATIGRQLKLRRKYVELLDRVFQFAALKIVEEPLAEEEEEEEEDLSENNGVVICPESPRAESASSTGSFSFQDPMPYLAAGMRAIVEDCVSKSFTPAELRTWNMLSRTKKKRYLRASPSLTVVWAVGFVVRWVFLMPVRVLLLVLSLVTLSVLCSIVGLLPNNDSKRRLNARVVVWCFDFVASSLSIVARFHDTENRPSHGIVVANHTSPIDSMVLATDQCYDMVGQKTRGILGMFMMALARSSHHIWFDRSEARERSQVSKMIEAHAQDPAKPPILIFPEGICNNNTVVLQFKKGAFELDSDIFPVAIRFDLRYGDPFWYQDTFGAYLFSMMTSWAIVCDVWYLPKTRRAQHESAVAFANRVKAQIAHRGGFVELVWDGFVKYSSSLQMKQTHWRKRQQEEFARHLSESEDLEVKEREREREREECERVRGERERDRCERHIKEA
nr:glycerol-3-phosphate acyltransferase 3-like [Procambarus clarkii]